RLAVAAPTKQRQPTLDPVSRPRLADMTGQRARQLRAGALMTATGSAPWRHRPHRSHRCGDRLEEAPTLDRHCFVPGHVGDAATDVARFVVGDELQLGW